MASPAASSCCSCCAWRWRAGSARVSDQQSRRHHLVPGKGTRHRHRLHVRPVRRPGVPDAGAGLAAAPLRLAHGVRQHGPVGHRLGRVWFMVYREPRQFKGANAAEIELIQQGGGVVDLESASRRKMPHGAPAKRASCPQGAPFALGGPAAKESAVLVDRSRPGHVPAQAVGRVPGPVLPDLDAVVLPDLVPDLSGEVPRHGLHQVGLPGLGAFLAAFVGVLCSGVLSDF